MNEDRQAGMFDHTIEDPDFEQALEDWIDDAENRANSARIAKRRREGFERHESKLRPGWRVRVGSLHFEVAERSSDGYEVEGFSRKGIKGVSRMDES